MLGDVVVGSCRVRWGAAPAKRGGWGPTIQGLPPPIAHVDYTPARMGGCHHRTLLLALALLLAPLGAQAGPMERVDKLLADGRYDDAATVARKWVERNQEDGEEREAMTARLAEAEYQRLLATPSLARTQGWRLEFADAARRDDVDSLEANLRLYAAAEAGTEAAYLEVADAWAGTAAAREARGRAEEIAFVEAETEGSAAALSAFLGRYEDMSHFDEALGLWRAVAWLDAEAADSVQVWRELRMQDPDHPRAPEALLHEQARALAELGADASAADLMDLARRYPEGPAGWEALQRATDHAILRALDADGVLLAEEALGPGIGPAAASLALGPAARLELVHADRLPRGGRVEVLVQAEIDGRMVPWQRATFRQAARWGVRSEATTDAVSDGAFVTPKPLCAGDLLGSAEVQVVITLGERRAEWKRPLRLDHPCAGPLPWAVRRHEGKGLALRNGQASVALGGDLMGQAWACDGPLITDPAGVLAVCGGWAVRPFHAGWLVQAPPAVPAAYEDDLSPWLDALSGEGWRALDVPDGWHFGGRPACPLTARAAAVDGQVDGNGVDGDVVDGDSAGEPILDLGEDAPPGPAPEAPVESAATDPNEPAGDEAEEPAPEPPIGPAWLPEEAQRWARAVDGSSAEAVVAAHGTPGAGTLVLDGGPLSPGVAWVADWPEGIDPETAGVEREGCSLRWTPAP